MKNIATGFVKYIDRLRFGYEILMAKTCVRGSRRSVFPPKKNSDMQWHS